MEEEKIKKFPSESIQSEEEETIGDAEMAEEEPSKYDSALLSDSKSSISSTAFSRTETPDEQSYGLPIDTIKTKHEDDPEKLKKDIAARGIIIPGQKLSEQSSLRGSLMSTALVSERISENDLNQDIPESEESTIPLEPAANVDADLIDSRPSSVSTSLSVEVPLKVEQTDSGSEQKLSSHSPELVRVGERETSFISRQGNVMVELSSTCTQTESSWLKDLEFYEEISHFRPEWIDEMKSIKQRKESKSSSGSAKVTFFKRRKKKSGSEPRSTASPYAEKRVSSRIDAEEKIEKEEKEEEEEVEEEKFSREPSFQQSRQSFPSPSPQSPIREDDMLYRPPTVEMSSESSSEEEYEYSPDESTLIPSIGPPSILQYIKESQQPPMMKEEADSREEALGSENLRRSLFSGPCMFCKKEILPFPTEEEIENADLKSSDLFCCPPYENYIKLELANNKSFMRDELIDIKPHPPFGTKASRKAAKERAAERARQREMDRQKAAGASAVANQNFYALARQMKTITYSLASTKCMEEGWTVKPLSPAPSEGDDAFDPFVIEVNPIQQKKRGFLERFYENGQRFLIILPDGTGCCYYPSGNIAVIITSTEKGKFTYLAFADTDDYERTRSNMLAVFDPSGHGTCYFRNSGIVRLVLDPYGGVLLDTYGARKKKWLWHNLKQHVHAPPFQPITFSITKQLSIRCLAQDKIILTFNQGKYTAKFNVGSKLKAVRAARPPLDRVDYEVHLAESKQFINILLDRTQNALRLPNYPRLDKIPLPHRLQKTKQPRRSKLEVLRTASQADTSTVTVN